MRRRRLLIAAAALALAAAGGALLLARDEPSGLTVEPRSIDFGRVPHGDEVERSLIFTNATGRQVILRDPTANCSCFFVDPSFNHLLHPGESTEVKIRLRSAIVPAEPLRGKKLTVVTTDAGVRQVEVPLRGDILPVRRIEPTRIDLGTLEPEGDGTPGPWSVRVRPGPGYRILVRSATVSRAELFEVEPTAAEEGYDIVVRVKPDARGTGPFQATVTLEIEATDEAGVVRRFADTVTLQGTWR